MTDGLVLFDTGIGRCGLAWNDLGVAAVQLPERRDALTRARLRGRVPRATEQPAPHEVEQAVSGIVSLLEGDRVDLGFVELDLRGVPPFHRRVYEAARAVPAGATTTYGELAARVHAPRSARAVGQAMAHNPFPIVVPCHRVLSAGGRVGGFSADGGLTTKRKMLAIEGVVLT
jgi:methylated-DNA-[protein]-cysteine S-methyltransferase